MAELELIGLIGNICQFIDFGQKLISSAIQIYQSSSGASVESSETELIENDFSNLRNILKESLPNSAANDKELQNICQKCDNIAVDLLRELEKLKVKDGKNKFSRKVRCFWKATKEAWGSDYIEAQKKRLNELKDELHLHVTVDLRSRLLQFFHKFPLLVERLDQREQATLNAIKSNTAFIEEVQQKIEFLNIRQHEETRNVILQQQLLEKLAIASGAVFNSNERLDQPYCLPNTRKSVLRQIYEWIDGEVEHSHKPLYWLTGLAGTGKSTIAQSVARELSGKNRLGASFFFSRDKNDDVRRSRLFCTSIARQLAQHSAEFERQITAALAVDKTVLSRSLNLQWQQLVLDPLLKLKDKISRSPLLIVIDALDECADTEHIELLTSLLAQLIDLGASFIKVLLSSRPDSLIRESFEKISQDRYEEFVLHKVPRREVDEDIRLLLKTEFTKIQKKRKLPSSWPSDDHIEALVQRAQGLFIWADTACRFVSEGGLSFTKTRFSKLVDNDTYTAAPEKGLDKLYLTILTESISIRYAVYEEEELEELCEIIKIVLSAIVISFSAMSITSLHQLTHLEEFEIIASLEHYHALLDIQDQCKTPIQIHHPSFRDFLVNGKRCTDDRFLVDETNAHAKMAIYCIRLMSLELNKDICSLHEVDAVVEDVPKEKIESCISETLCYACLYWVDHLQRGSNYIDDDSSAHTFLQRHLTHWLEALSLVGKLSEAVRAITTLESTARKGSGLREFCESSRRFIHQNLHIIKTTPLQIYCSALLFAPLQSLVGVQFKEEVLPGINLLTNPNPTRNYLLQAFDGYSVPVQSVRFSPSGSYLISAAGDATLILCDLNTGFEIQRFNCNGKTMINLYAFSSDDAMLVLVDEDVISLWRTSTGTKMLILEGHFESVSDIVFLSQNKQIAAFTNGCEVRIWETASGRLSKVFEARYLSQFVVANSGKHLAWMSGEMIEYIDLIEIGSDKRSLKGPNGSTRWLDIGCMPNSSSLISVCANHITQWDMDSGTVDHILQLDHSCGSSARISQDCRYVGINLYNKRFQLWKVPSGNKILQIESVVNDFLINSSSNILAIISFPGIDIFGIDTGEKLGTLDSRSITPGAIALSPDGRVLASGGFDGSVHLWDMHTSVNNVTDEACLPLTADVEKVNPGWLPMAILTDKELIALAQEAGKVIIKDLRIGRTTQILTSGSSGIEKLGVSRQSEFLAVFHHDKTTCLWHVELGKMVSRINTPKPDDKLFFSPNGTTMARIVGKIEDVVTVQIKRTRSTEKSSEVITVYPFGWPRKETGNDLVFRKINNIIELLDIVDYEDLFTFQSAYVQDATLSQSGNILALASYRKIEVWQISSQRRLQALHFDLPCPTATCLAISPNDELLAAASTRSIELWNIRKRESIGEYDSTVLVNWLSFSAEGHLLDTTFGQLCVRCAFPALSSALDVETCKLGGLHINGNWVMKDRKRVLLLPAECRAEYAMARGNTIAIRTVSGSTELIRVDGDDFRIC